MPQCPRDVTDWSVGDVERSSGTGSQTGGREPASLQPAAHDHLVEEAPKMSGGTLPEPRLGVAPCRATAQPLREHGIPEGRVLGSPVAALDPLVMLQAHKGPVDAVPESDSEDQIAHPKREALPGAERRSEAENELFRHLQEQLSPHQKAHPDHRLPMEFRERDMTLSRFRRLPLSNGSPCPAKTKGDDLGASLRILLPEVADSQDQIAEGPDRPPGVVQHLGTLN